jgi:hypothetical protein
MISGIASYIDSNTKDWVTLIKSSAITFFNKTALPYVINLLFGGGRRTQ